MSSFLLEIAAFSLDGAVMAQASGADRIEFCENPADGGTTPSFGNLVAARRQLHIPVFPIIRPRAGNFCYNNDEFEAMKQDVLLCKQLGFEGVVTGILEPDGAIDVKRTGHLVALAYPMEVTFHRAFDRCRQPEPALEQIIQIGCHRILTSGQYPTAMEGSDLIVSLVQQADDRIIIMPGSGVNSKNVGALFKKTGALEWHASARLPRQSGMNFKVDSMQETLDFMSVDPAEIKAMLRELSMLAKRPDNKDD